MSFFTITAWMAAAASVALIIWGDDFLKQAAEAGGKYFSKEAVFAFLLYGAGAPFWIYVMQYKSLTQVAIMYSTLTIIGVMMLGILRYHEVPTNWQIFALVLAIGAIITSEI